MLGMQFYFQGRLPYIFVGQPVISTVYLHTLHNSNLRAEVAIVRNTCTERQERIRDGPCRGDELDEEG
jgi:hypothetical protein